MVEVCISDACVFRILRSLTCMHYNYIYNVFSLCSHYNDHFVLTVFISLFAAKSPRVLGRPLNRAVPDSRINSRLNRGSQQPSSLTTSDVRAMDSANRMGTAPGGERRRGTAISHQQSAAYPGTPQDMTGRASAHHSKK